MFSFLQIGYLSSLTNLILKKNEMQSKIKDVQSLEKQAAVLTGVLDCSNGPNATDNVVLEGVWTALVMLKAVSQQHISNYVPETEKLAVQRASLEKDIRKYRTDQDNKILGFQTTFKNETKRSNGK